MHEHHHRDLPWLDRLTIAIPGYRGYQDRANRRSADRALRDAIASRLGSVRVGLERLIHACVDRGALTEVNALERVERHLDRLIQRVRSAGSGTDAFHGADSLDPSKTDTLHALDLQLHEHALDLARRLVLPDTSHDFLADVEADLAAFEQKLDERALLLQGFHG
ncbi:MAG TPA: hypothetical protein VF590_18050 [Isosphaeraceae bacterium]|jgi:hypothetical protein